MSDGRHLLILPIVYAIILPVTVFFIRFFEIAEFFSNMLIILGFIFVAWNLIEYNRIFIQQKGNSKKFSNAILSKKLIKLFILGSVLLIGSELLLEYKEFNTIVSEDNLDQLGAKGLVFFQFKLTFMISAISSGIPILFLFMSPSYNYGQSFAYFQIGLNNTKKIRKIWAYQNAIETYNHYLKEDIGVQLKNLQQIESKIILENMVIVDQKIKSLFTDHENKLNPAIELSKWIDVEPKDALKPNSFLENSEKWIRFLPLIPAILPIVVLIFLHYNPPNIP